MLSRYAIEAQTVEPNLQILRKKFDFNVLKWLFFAGTQNYFQIDFNMLKILYGNHNFV